MSVADKRIAIVGAHGVGKNTVAIKLLEKEKMSKRGVNVTYMPETVRSTMFMNSELLAKEIGGNLDSCAWLYHKHWSQMLEHEYSADVFIVKRLPLDYVVFNKCAYDIGMCKSTLPLQYLELAVEQAKQFNEVYFVRHNPEHKLIKDHIRKGPAASEELQPLWDSNYKKIIDEYMIPVVEGTAGEILEKI